MNNDTMTMAMAMAYAAGRQDETGREDHASYFAIHYVELVSSGKNVILRDAYDAWITISAR